MNSNPILEHLNKYEVREALYTLDVVNCHVLRIRELRNLDGDMRIVCEDVLFGIMPVNDYNSNKMIIVYKGDVLTKHILPIGIARNMWKYLVSEHKAFQLKLDKTKPSSYKHLTFPLNTLY